MTMVEILELGSLVREYTIESIGLQHWTEMSNKERTERVQSAIRSVAILYDVIDEGGV